MVLTISSFIFMTIGITLSLQQIKEEKRLKKERNNFDKKLLDRLDQILTLEEMETLYCHINANLSILAPDVDSIDDLTREINLPSFKFQNPGIEYLKKEASEDLISLNNYVMNNFDLFRTDISIMLMPDLRNSPERESFVVELRNRVSLSFISYSKFRLYCHEELIK